MREETMPKQEEGRNPRRSTNGVLIVVALALAAGRIAMVTSREGDTAFLSANDRSRWCTVASLVEHRTYAIDAQIDLTSATNSRHHPWDTIDKVRHLGKDGDQHYYSSKPPLFPTLVAGIYWLISTLSGMTLTDQPIYVTRIILAMVNLPLLALFLVGTKKSIERVCMSYSVRQFCTLCTCFGTMLLPFAISLNNHLPAAAATAAVMWIYLYAAEKLDDEHRLSTVSPWCWLAAGVGAAMAAANELPALSMMVFWLILFAMLDRKSILPFAAGAVIVAGGFFGTNWMAHESLRPAYAHRGNGALIAELESATAEADIRPDVQVATDVRDALSQRGLIPADTRVRIVPSDEPQRWLVEADQRQYALLHGGSGWRLAQWDDWYEYTGTYWKDGERRGVDQGESSRFIYLLQMLVGHHGIFSLTPIWILVPIGLIAGLSFGPPDFRRLALAILTASVVCLLFYLSRPLIDRNYGGVSVCFRWMLWFAPLWLLMIAPVMQQFAQKPRRRIILVAMLALSVFSVSTALDTPWQSPWMYQFWVFLGWINP
jgi:hypothetical protein